MLRWEVLAAIAAARVVGIVRESSGEAAVATAGDLLDGGLRVVEVALTTPDGLDAVREVARAAGDGAVVGAGTVLDPETARLAVLAGARFLVAPALDPRVGAVAHRYGAAWVPGVQTPTEILTALSAGADAIKLFPASATTPAAMRDVLAALPQAPLIPTGGLGIDDVPAWLEAGAVAVGLGSALSRGGPATTRALLARLAA
jgi:2-dehydro-3-deoxyphosphogluconate aldolase/(4S)-4-hydroxy-2-oxoglutarate aldolase